MILIKIALVIGVWYYLCRLYGHFNQKKINKKNVEEIKLKVSGLDERLNSVSKYFHPTFELDEAKKTISKLKLTDIESVSWNCHLFEELEEKIMYREFAINKIESFDLDYINFLRKKKEFGEKDFEEINEDFLKLKSLLNKDLISWSISDILYLIEVIPLKIKYYKIEKQFNYQAILYDRIYDIQQKRTPSSRQYP